MSRPVRPGAVRGAAPALALVLLLTGPGVAGCSSGQPSGQPSGQRSPGSPASPAGSTQAAVTGGADPTDPVTVFELADPLVHYQQYVASQLTVLVTQTAALARDTAAGDDAAAKLQWLQAHLTYHRIGAAYGAFGDLGEAVDGLPGGLPRGVDDPGFTGFHAVERLLWRGGGARAAAPAARRLAADATALRAKSDSLEIKANDFTIRAHEILEDTLQTTLTGADDFGSGSGLATAGADLDGTRTVVGILSPVLERRSPGLPAAIGKELDAARAALAGIPAGQPAGGALPLSQRQRLDAAVGQALETLSALPGLLEVPEED